MRRTITSLAGSLALAASLLVSVSATAMAAATDEKAVAEHFAAVGLAKFEDAAATARDLDAAIGAFLAAPSEEGLKAAREAWKKARVPYLRTEVYRFGNPVVDDWEGRVNAWPLDEGLIDYVDESYGSESDENALFIANVIASKTVKIDGKDVDASTITPELIAGKLHSAGGVDANVASGYHAIEFLLWGQDLNGTGPGAGNRPYTDYDPKNCTGGNCDRRAAYLKAASALLVADLQEMADKWKPGGEAAKVITDDPRKGVAALLTGMGSLSYGELAGERMKLGLLLHDPEEEQDCFSDNTHNSHLNDARGLQEAYTGTYERVDGTKMAGPSLSELVAARDKALDAELSAKLQKTVSAMEAIAKRAEGGEAYDQMLAEGNTEGNALIQTAVDDLVDQTKSIQRVISVLGLSGITLEGSDSLDNPGAVAQ
ncbi:imelysin family protein [Gellertiella hungarica]|uniref:Putative iron-regulated protein n=1 Tax=Gellertiella hungarica TaxID=1572859 RepID=A0A7W6NJU5_9HYPH|nr:imelysin family protein [Gellertiella hungarica]MBB4063730.1 putative iron-regulated protein [Gellertiella hungarica]